MLYILIIFCSPNRHSRADYKSNPRTVSPSPIRYHSPGGLATHLSYKVTSKSSKEAAASSATSSSTNNSGLRLSNLTPPGSRKYGTYSMGGNHSERSDSGYGGSGGNATMLKTPPVGRKVATSDKGKKTHTRWFPIGQSIEAQLIGTQLIGVNKLRVD